MRSEATESFNRVPIRVDSDKGTRFFILQARERKVSLKASPWLYLMTAVTFVNSELFSKEVSLSKFFRLDPRLGSLLSWNVSTLQRVLFIRSYIKEACSTYLTLVVLQLRISSRLSKNRWRTEFHACQSCSVVEHRSHLGWTCSIPSLHLPVDYLGRWNPIYWLFCATQNRCSVTKLGIVK